MGSMSNINWNMPNENTMFYLAEAQEEFLKNFGVETKGVQSLRRWVKGLRVPTTGELVKLEFRYTPGRLRQISLKMYNDFLERLDNAYQRAIEQENRSN